MTYGYPLPTSAVVGGEGSAERLNPHPAHRDSGDGDRVAGLRTASIS